MTEEEIRQKLATQDQVRDIPLIKGVATVSLTRNRLGFKAGYSVTEAKDGLSHFSGGDIRNSDTGKLHFRYRPDAIAALMKWVSWNTGGGVSLRLAAERAAQAAERAAE